MTDIRALARPGLDRIPRYEPGEDRADHVKLSSNENPRPPHPRIVEAVARAMERANRYPASGVPRLVAALAAHHGVGRDEVIVGAGSNEIIDLLVRSFAGPAHNVVYPRPSFIVYDLVPRICGVEGRAVDCVDARLDLDGMRRRVDANTRLVFVCNPNNPTSTYVTADELDAFVDALPETTLVVLDEAYIEYVDAPDFPDALALRRRRDTIVVLRTFSKFHALAGVRVGYALADAGVIDVLHRTRQPFNVSSVAEAAALAALEVADELAAHARETIRERERVRGAFVEAGVACPPSQTNFLYVDTGQSDVDLHAELLRRGIVVRPLGQFGGAGRAFRVTVGSPGENDRLVAAVREIFAGPSDATR